MIVEVVAVVGKLVVADREIVEVERIVVVERIVELGCCCVRVQVAVAECHTYWFDY